MKSLRSHWSIITIVTVSFLTKLRFLTWGFPAILHNDESNVIRSSLGMRFGDLNPHHFDWPSLYLYLNYFLFWVFIKLRTRLQIIFGVEEMKEMFPFWWGPDLPFLLISRVATNIFIILIALLTYKMSLKLLHTKKLAILAAVIFLVGSWVTYFSFYALLDSALIFFMLVSFYFALKTVKSKKTKYYLLAGLFAGIATSIKYNGAFICLAIPIAHILRTRKPLAIFDRKILVATIASVIAFFVGTPYALLDWDVFTQTGDSSGALWQTTHINLGWNAGYQLLHSLPQNFGVLIVILGFLGAYYAWKSKSNDLKFLSAIALAYILFVSLWGARAHYTYPVFPLFSILAAYGYSVLIKTKRKNIKHIGKVLLVFMLLQPLTGSFLEITKRAREDTRIISGRWITQNIPIGSYIQADTELTEYFGGDLPVFEYRDYRVSTPSRGKHPEGAKETFIIHTQKEGDSKMGKAIYKLSNNLRTGPEIQIYKITSP